MNKSSKNIIIIDGKQYKECFGCNRTLPIEEFFRNRQGHLNYCRECKRKQNAIIIQKRKEKLKAEIERIKTDPDYSPCQFCKSYSTNNMMNNKRYGWCLVLKREVSATFTCDRWQPDRKIKYVL